MASVSKYEPDQPRDDHGRWGSGGGASGGDSSLKDRATASMADPEFRAEHADRLAQADTEARRNYPRDQHSADANQAASAWQHAEAGRILTEHAAHGGDTDLKRAADAGRSYARGTGKTELTEQHEEAMRSIADRKPALEQERAEHAARDAGAVPALPAAAQAAIAEHEALQTTHSGKLDDLGNDLHGAHQQALRSLHELHGMASEGDAESLPSHYELAEHYGQTHSDLRDGEHGYEEIGDSVTRHDPVEPPDGIELDDHGKPEPWSPSASGYTKEHEDTLSIDEETGKVEPWSAEHFSETHSSAGFERLEFDDSGKPIPWSGSQTEHDPEGHAYRDQAARYEQALADHKAEYERVAADYERHRDADKVDHAAKVEQYKQAVAARERETQAQAEKTQAHLEALHEKQTAALTSIRDMNKAEGKSSTKAQKELDKIGDDEVRDHVSATTPFAGKTRNDDGEYHDSAAERLHQHARSAYERDLGGAGDKLHEDDRPSSLEDTHDNLKESAKATAAVIRQLARFSGRAARLAGGKAKKSANRPGVEPGASVWNMAAPTTPYFRLRLKALKFISAVDAGAQGPIANVALIKRVPTGETVDATFRVVKLDEKLGLVFGWALATSLDGGATPHVDLQDDAIVGDDELIKIAAEFMEASAASDVMHDDNPDGKIVFCMPLTKDVSTALGVTSKVHGLAVAMRPSKETFQRFVAKELNAFSIAGTGIRELVKATDAKCLSCDKYGKADDKGNCPSCGKAMKRARRTKRLAPTRKQAVLTSAVDGHQHQIDLDDPADGWSDQLTTSYNTSEGADAGHCHAWIYDATTGVITVAEDSGHTHTVEAVVPADVIAQAKLNDSGTRCPGCSEMCEAGCRFCSKCGCAMDRRDAPPAATAADDGPPVIVIAARAPAAISTPPAEVSTVKDITEEHQMADPNELAALKAENALLKHMASMTDAHRDHHNRLLAKGIKSDADAFLVLDKAQRNVVLAEIEKSNVEVYTSKSNGRVYRMSDDVEKIEAAKQTDAMLEMTKRAEDKERELDFLKRAGELIPGCFKGVKNNVPTRLIKAIRAEFKEPAELAEAEKALKQYETALAMLSKSTGYSSTDDTATDTPAKRFDAAINDYAKRNNMPIALAIAKATESDPEIRRLYNEASLLAS